MKNSEFQLTKKVITALVTSCLLGSCASETYQTAVKQGRDDNATASRLEQESHGTANRADLSTIQVHDGIYLGAEAVKTHGGQVLPDRFEQEGVRLVAAQPLDLNGLGDLLTQATGIPVSFAADVFAPAQTAPTGGPGGMGMAGGMAGGSRQATIPSRSTAADLAAALNAASANNAHPVADLGMATPMLFTDGATSSSRGKMHINYKGPLSGFLNQTGAYFDISWTYRDGRIQFQRNVTRTFTLVTMPTIVQSESDVNSGISGSGGSGGGSGGSGGGSGGGGGGSSGGGSSGGSGGSGGSSSSGGLTVGASQTASVTVALDFWKDLEKTLKTILGSSGNFSTSTSMSEVTVTAPPSQIARVADYIQGVNKQLLRQVTVQVQVYSVNVSASSDWQFQLNAFFKSHGILSGGLGGASSGGLAPGASENLPQSAILTFGGKLAGSQAVLQALDSLGTTDVVTSASVTTMSGQPVPLQVGKTTGYVSQIGSTSLSDTSSSTTATASTISSGFSLNVLPKVMDDGKVLLQYSINLSSLAGQDRGFDSVDIGGGQKMEVPDINQRSFIQEGMIDNGATLVLAGFEAMQDNSTDNGMGTPNFKLLGGTRSGAHDRQVLVICITPVVLDHSGSLPGYN